MSRPTVTLAMIVRDGGAGLARCLKSALPGVDSIVVGDTGSSDGSAEIARHFGARVLNIPWRDDFSQARNAVLDSVESDWVLWLDADEMLSPAGAAQIPMLIAQDEIDAFEVWRWNYVRTLNSRSGGRVAEANPMAIEESHPYPAYTRYLNTLFFRRLPGLYFENPVHETVSRRVRALGLRAAEAPFVVHHFGFVEGPEEVRHAKNEYYHGLGTKKVRENPRDAWAHYELGLSELEHRRNPAAALLCFEQARALNPGNRDALVYAGICLTRMGRIDEARKYLENASNGLPSRLLAEALGDVYFQQGQDAEALRCYEIAGSSPVLECKRGACQVRLGEQAAGLARIQTAVAREPNAGELHEIWAAALLQAGEIAAAAQVAQRRLSLSRPPAASFLVAALLEAHLGQWDQALTTLLDGQKFYPGDSTLVREARLAQEKAATMAAAR
jgi:tetratricopeptide (TPR) repeat protein